MNSHAKWFQLSLYGNNYLLTIRSQLSISSNAVLQRSLPYSRGFVLLGSAPLSCSAWVSTLLPWLWQCLKNWGDGKNNCFGTMSFSISPKDPQYCLSFENPVLLHLFLMWVHTIDVDSCCCSLAWTCTELFPCRWSTWCELTLNEFCLKFTK